MSTQTYDAQCVSRSMERTNDARVDYPAALPQPYMQHWINCPFESINLYTEQHLQQHANKAFFRGALIGLQHMFGHDAETMYREFVADVGAAALVRAAKEEDAIEWSGLRRYGYCDSLGRYRAKHVRRTTGPAA